MRSLKQSGSTWIEASMADTAVVWNIRINSDILITCNHDLSQVGGAAAPATPSVPAEVLPIVSELPSAPIEKH